MPYFSEDVPAVTVTPSSNLLISIVSGLNIGAKKIRMNASPTSPQILLISLYAKSKTANLTAAHLKDLRHDYKKISPIKRRGTGEV